MRNAGPSLALCLIALGAVACQRDGGGAAPTEPVETAAAPATASSPAADPDQIPSGCVAACIEARQMEAVGVDVIEASCRDQCAKDPNAYPR